MDSTEILKALERERTLLEDFICLSEEQLLRLEDENIDAVDSLLQKRADLMMELTAIEATLGTWIAQIRTDPAITPEMVQEFRAGSKRTGTAADCHCTCPRPLRRGPGEAAGERRNPAKIHPLPLGEGLAPNSRAFSAATPPKRIPRPLLQIE